MRLRSFSLVGYGGKNLRGKIFKKEDPDVVDSDMVLDYAVPLMFPPLSPETSDLSKSAGGGGNRPWPRIAGIGSNRACQNINFNRSGIRSVLRNYSGNCRLLHGRAWNVPGERLERQSRQ